MKECVRVKRLLSRYLDKEARVDDVILVEAHLDSCPICKKELSESLRVKEFISKRQRKALPRDYLVCRLREEIAGEYNAQKRFSWLAGIGGLSRKLIPIPVTVIVLSIALLILSSRQQVNEYLLEEHILSGAQTTAETAAVLILGAQN